mmetsp:Transcript_36823/g.66211  ORF Transcript_36823/g.66211 Transcript_36823/m.66211 type:complete len:111 (-) Transcript_36823:8-340(-)
MDTILGASADVMILRMKANFAMRRRTSPMTSMMRTVITLSMALTTATIDVKEIFYVNNGNMHISILDPSSSPSFKFLLRHFVGYNVILCKKWNNCERGKRDGQLCNKNNY